MSRSLALLAIALVAGCGAWYWWWYSPPATAPGWSVQTEGISVHGVARNARVFTPASLPDGAPLLLAFHGSLGDGATMRAMTGYRLEVLAERHGFAVAYPDGVGGHFNTCRRAEAHEARALGIDDIAFVRALVAKLAEEHGIDATRVFAIGYSNGGHMAMRLALEAPETVRGIGVFGASLPDDDNLACVPAPGAVPVMLVNGTRDPINPYAGGEVTLFGFASRGAVRSVAESAAWFARRNGLSGPAHPVSLLRQGKIEVRMRTWAGASGQAPVMLVTVDGGGHTLPQSAYRFPRLLGRTLASDTIFETLVRFFGLDRDSIETYGTPT